MNCIQSVLLLTAFFVIRCLGLGVSGLVQAIEAVAAETIVNCSPANNPAFCPAPYCVCSWTAATPLIMTFGSDIVTITTADEVYTANPDGSCPTTTPIESVGPQIVVVSKTDSTCGTVTHYQPCNGVGNAATVTSPPICKSTSPTVIASSVSPTITASSSAAPPPPSQTTTAPILSSTASSAPIATVCSTLIGPEGSTACECTPGGETEMQFGDTCGTSTYLPSEPCPTAYVNAANGNNPINEQFIACQCNMDNGKLTPNAHIMQANDGACTPELAISAPSCQLDGSHSPYTCDCSTWNPGSDTGSDVYNPCWEPS